MNLLKAGIWAAEAGVLPDGLTRLAIRHMCQRRLREEGIDDTSRRHRAYRDLLESMNRGPIALVPEVVNQQHYEVPAEFFAAVLGPRLKYSCLFWNADTNTLAEAEELALAITCERAQLADGQDVLELGCGWGSLSLWMAAHYPHSRVTAVSNSTIQRQFIVEQARLQGLHNLAVVTADMNDFVPLPQANDRARFDRIISVEMFEHMRNYEQLLARIASWLRPDGKLFVHLFCHRLLAYPFEAAGEENWMGQHFFSGGIMPSQDLLKAFDRHLRVVEQWSWNGQHYRRTADAWLDNLDAHRAEAVKILERTYGETAAWRWLNRWRMFFLAVAELFGYEDGEEWHVAHYLLEPVEPAV